MNRRSQKQLRLFKQCIYCGAVKTSKDHAPPKSLLEKPYPPNLSTLPSCDACNNGYADAERYVRDVVHHVSFSALSREKLSTWAVVARSLGWSSTHKSRIENGYTADGYFRPESEPFDQVFEKVACGFWFLRYERLPNRQRFHSIAVEHAKDLSPWLRDLSYVSEPAMPGMWPEVGSSSLERSARSWPRLPEPVARQWQVVQSGVFEYLMVKHIADATKYLCIMNLYDAVWGCVECPIPRGSRTTRQLFE